MERQFIPFGSSWRMPIDIRVSRGVASEGRLFICGQCDLDDAGRPQRPGDLAAQTAVALDHLLDVVRQAGLKARDLAHLHVFYRSDGSVDEPRYEALLAKALPAARPTTVLTPVPAFFYPGLEVEIDAIACTADDGREPASRQGNFPSVTRRGGLVFVRSNDPPASADTAREAEAALNSLIGNLKHCGASAEQLCKLTVYLSAEADESERDTAREVLRAGLPTPPPCLTFVVHSKLAGGRVRIEGIAADPAAVTNLEKRDGLQAVRCGRLLFVGGLLSLDHKARVMRPQDLSSQTHLVMDSLGQHLAAFGADFEHLVKVNTYYRSDGGAEALHENLSIRSSYYASPGPASTGIPVPAMDPPGAMISVDAIAAI